MRNIKALAAGSLIGLGTLAATPAMAEVSTSLGVSTEYIFRGAALGSPQVWGAIDYSGVNGTYAGSWISSTTGGNEEVDLYAGFATDIFDVGFIYYMFPSVEVAAAQLNATEVYGGVALGNFSAYLWYAPSGFETIDDDEYAYLDFAYEIPLNETMSLGTHVGYVALLGDAYEPAATGTPDTDDGFFDFGVTLNVGDFYVAATYLEENAGSLNYGAAAGGAFDNPSISAGYSWTLE